MILSLPLSLIQTLLIDNHVNSSKGILHMNGLLVKKSFRESVVRIKVTRFEYSTFY
jgi:hypothetical protein